MNTKQAKRIKKQIYGDMVSGPEGRKYLTIGHKVEVTVKDKNGIPVKHKYISNQTINHPDSSRAKYQAAKKAWKKGQK